MVKRKKPIRHKVRSHKREGKSVRSFTRGSGTSRKNPSKVVGATPREVSKEPRLVRTRHHLTKLIRSGVDRIHQTEMIYAPADQIEDLVRDTLTKSHKAGYILSEDFDKNIDTVRHWEVIRERVNDTRREIREFEEAIVDMREQIARVESGKMKAWEPMLPTYRERLKEDLKSLSREKRILEVAKTEFKPLKATIKSLKDNFKIYIANWRKE